MHPEPDDRKDRKMTLGEKAGALTMIGGIGLSIIASLILIACGFAWAYKNWLLSII